MEAWKCERCGHVWMPRGSEKPKVCSRCKSPYWDEPRKNDEMCALGEIGHGQNASSRAKDVY